MNTTVRILVGALSGAVIIGTGSLAVTGVAEVPTVSGSNPMVSVRERSPEPPKTVVSAQIEATQAAPSTPEPVRPAPEKIEKPAPVQKPVSRETSKACNWQAEYERARAGAGNWHVQDTGSWGSTEVEGPNPGAIYIAPRTPCDKVFSVGVHEKMHRNQLKIYGTYANMQKQLAAYGGVEVNADCASQQAGATWTDYHKARCVGQKATGGLATARGQLAPGTSPK